MSLLSHALESPIGFLVLAMLILLASGLGALLLLRPRLVAGPAARTKMQDAKPWRRAA